MVSMDFEEVPAAAAISGLLPERVLDMNNSTQVADFIRRKDIKISSRRPLPSSANCFHNSVPLVLEVSSDPEESAEWLVLHGDFGRSAAASSVRPIGTMSKDGCGKHLPISGISSASLT